jgi:hypothetical protein
MLGKKKNMCTSRCIIISAIMKALGIYFGVLGVRLQMICFDWLCIDAMLSYLVAVLLFMWGTSICTYKK